MSRRNRADGGDGSLIRRCRWQSPSNATERSLSRFLEGTPPERRPEPVQLPLIELQADFVSVPPVQPPQAAPQTGAFSSADRHDRQGAVLVTPPLCLMSETSTDRLDSTSDCPGGDRE